HKDIPSQPSVKLCRFVPSGRMAARSTRVDLSSQAVRIRPSGGGNHRPVRGDRMRYPFVLACFAMVLFATACTLDDGDEPADDSATAVAGKDIVLDIGVARVQISALNIGSGAGQIPEGSKLRLK